MASDKVTCDQYDAILSSQHITHRRLSGNGPYPALPPDEERGPKDSRQQIYAAGN